MKLFKKLFSKHFAVGLTCWGFSSYVWAAACCGGGFAAPALIAGEDRAQFTSSVSFSKITDDVYASGIWRKRTNSETSQVLRLEGAHIFMDRWQAGASIPVVRRERAAADSHSGLGDMALNVGYEYLPDWDYNPWRPKGLGFLQLTLPTGTSIYENTDGLSSRGRGFWALGAGTLLTKFWGAWDIYTSLEIHHAFAKKVDNTQMQGTVRPGFGSSFGGGGGWSWQDWRVGGSLLWTYEDAIDVEGSSSSQGTVQRYATATASVSYMLPEDMAGTVSYSDQTLFGAPLNTTLSQSVMFSLQKRWSR